MRIDASHNCLTELKKQVKGLLENLELFMLCSLRKVFFT